MAADTQSQFLKYVASYPDKLLLWEKVLPMPPSVNQLYAYGRSGPYLKREITIFREQVKALIGPINHTPYDDRIAIDIFATAKDYARRDMDNLNKCLLDAMTKAGVYADDFQLDDVRIRRAATKKGNPHVLVRIYRLNDIKVKDWERMEREGFYQMNGAPYACKTKAAPKQKTVPTSSAPRSGGAPPQ